MCLRFSAVFPFGNGEPRPGTVPGAASVPAGHGEPLTPFLVPVLIPEAAGGPAAAESREGVRGSPAARSRGGDGVTPVATGTLGL